MSPMSAVSRPTIAAGFRLQWEPAQDSYVLLYPEGMVKLNHTAAAILTRCDGVRTVEQLVAELERSYSMRDLGAEVHAFLELAVERNWLELGT
jgi:pyrroloquinoline quinone biosynthesis protein D